MKQKCLITCALLNEHCLGLFILSLDTAGNWKEEKVFRDSFLLVSFFFFRLFKM